MHYFQVSHNQWPQGLGVIKTLQSLYEKDEKLKQWWEVEAMHPLYYKQVQYFVFGAVTAIQIVLPLEVLFQ